jgi:hypothetical protein
MHIYPLDIRPSTPHNRTMAKVTVLIGVLLIVVGVGAFLASDPRATTALIPAYAGVPMAILGFFALKPNLKMHAMHAAVMISLLGFLMSAVVLVIRLVRGQGTTLGRFTLIAMAALTLIHVILCVRSFIAARKARQAGFDVVTK